MNISLLIQMRLNFLKNNTMDRGLILVKKQWFEVLMFKTFIICLLKQTAFHFSRDMWIAWGLLWCFYQLFGLSFWWHLFTVDDPLLSKLCNATFPHLFPWNNKLIIIGWPENDTFSANFYFGLNYSFKAAYIWHPSLHYSTVLVRRFRLVATRVCRI